MRNLVVLGGGITGISAAYHAKQEGIECICYEKSDVLGGLVSNFTIEGFRFDNAIHLSFTKNNYVKKLFSKTDYITHKPDAFCIENKIWFRHPIQNNLYPLKSEEKVALIKSFVERGSKEPSDYGEWLDHQYGEEISKRYPKKYTSKYWGCDASELSLSWIGDRMRRASLDEILLGAFDKKDLNHYYANEMRYPKNGGYFEFIRKIAESVDIKINKEIISLDTNLKEINFSDGSVEHYQYIINTLPLPVVSNLLKGVPEQVKKAADSLLWTTVDLISVGFNKPNIPPCLWYYIYDEDNYASRAYSPSMKSINNAPQGCSSLQFEIYNLSSKKNFDPDVLKKNISEKLLADNICKAEDIVFMHHKHLPFGNVVFDHNMEKNRAVVIEYLSAIGIESCGRFGEWDYLWSDQSFMSGKKAVESLMNNKSV